MFYGAIAIARVVALAVFCSWARRMAGTKSASEAV